MSADDYAFLMLMQHQQYDMYSASAILPSFDELKLEGWVTGDILDLPTVQLTNKANMLLGLDVDTVDDFCIKFRQLFKPTANGMMGDEFTVKSRMEWFKRRYDFSNDTILLATVKYIESNRRDRFKYMMAADNFIAKPDPMGEPISKLAAYCESANTDEGSDSADDNGFLRF